MSATIVVRSDSERMADPEPTIEGEGRRILLRPPDYLLTLGALQGFEESERRPTGGKMSATIVVRNDSERMADPEPTIEGANSGDTVLNFWFIK